jgi:hypothetical protein
VRLFANALGEIFTVAVPLFVLVLRSHLRARAAGVNVGQVRLNPWVQVALGVAIAFGGVFATAANVIFAGTGGGRYTVYWGMVLFGAVQCAYGLMQVRRERAERK